MTSDTNPQLTYIRGAIQKFPKCIREKETHTESPNRHCPLGSVHNDPNVSAMTGSCPGSPFVSAYSVPSAIRPGSPLRCQIFAVSTLFSSWGRGRSHRGLSQVSKGVGDDRPVFWKPKNAAQPKRCAQVRCLDGAPSCLCAIGLAASASCPRYYYVCTCMYRAFYCKSKSTNKCTRLCQ
jgi:hypothetical protein